MPPPLPLWFVLHPPYDRRRPANRLKRATREAEILEERQIDLWLELGRIALSEKTEKSARHASAAEVA
jgi:hypothetical protein